jgi:hypothetical protein
MNRGCWAAFVGCWLVVAAGGINSFAAPPQANIGVGSHTVGDSFFENNGVNFGFNIPAPMPTNGRSAVVGLTPQGAFNPAGIGFQQGGAGAVQPGVGGFVPNQADTFGFTLNSSLGSFNFGFTASQGSSRSLGSQSGSVTLMDGGTGFVSDASLRPFVTSVIPVVGGFAAGAQPQYSFPGPAPAVAPFSTSALGERLSRSGETPGPRDRSTGPNTAAQEVLAAAPQDEFARDLATARQSTAGRPAAGVAELRAQQAAADEAANAEFQAILARAEEAKSLGKPNVARIYYQQLARRATGDLKQRAIDELKAIESQGKSGR